MWVWRAFIFSLSIALLTAISAPARALENSPQSHQYTANLLADLHSDFSNTDSTKTFNNSTLFAQSLLSDYLLSKHQGKSKTQPDLDNSKDDSGSNTPNKTPSYQGRFNPNISLPAFERQAASVFGSVSQNEPIFVLAYEFQPEILGLKHFLAPLIANNAVPWYLRPDAANSHGRVAGWKDGNTLYSGAITYLS